MTSSPSNKLLLLSSTSSLSSSPASSATSNSQLQLTTSTTNDTYPRITVKSRPGALIVRETEKILDEKVIQRTEEISCPITGESKLQTVEYIEKLIETEVETCQEKIVSLELENVERSDPTNAKRIMTTTRRTTTTTTRTISGSDEEEEDEEEEKHNEEEESEEESDDSEEDDDDENMDSDKEHSIITIQSNNDATDFTINSNSFLKNNPGYNLVQTMTTTSTNAIGDASAIGNSSVPLQTIVEVINPILCGDGTANNITIGRSNDDFSYQSYDGEHYQQHDYRTYDDDDEYEVVQRRHLNGGGRSGGGFELSINDKMKNVLKELKSNERVRRSLSRSMEDEELGSEEEQEEEDEDEQDDVVDYSAGGGVREVHPGGGGEEEEADETYQSCASYEERKGSNGTVFIVRERLINDFYEHEQIANPEQVPDDDEEEEEDEEPEMLESRTTKNLYEKNMEFVDNCKIYTNPNVVEETYTYLDNRTTVEIDKDAAVPAAATIINSSTTTYTTVTPNLKYNKDNIKLDLNLNDKDVVAKATVQPELGEAAGVADEAEDGADIDAETPTTPTTPTANSNNNNSNLSSNTNSNNNTSNNNKKKKRKGKNKKK